MEEFFVVTLIFPLKNVVSYTPYNLLNVFQIRIPIILFIDEKPVDTYAALL